MVQGQGLAIPRLYVLKKSLTKAVAVKPKSKGYPSSSSGSSGAAVKRLQTQLAKRGLLGSGSVTGRYTSATTKAVRKYQMLAGLSVTGRATGPPCRKRFSPQTARAPKVTLTRWSASAMSRVFPKGSTATIVDLNTGARLRVRRAWAAPATLTWNPLTPDTSVLKRLYGGTWSWNSRAVLLIAGGWYMAGAINGMPHGAQISRSNNYDGQFLPAPVRQHHPRKRRFQFRLPSAQRAPRTITLTDPAKSGHCKGLFF